MICYENRNGLVAAYDVDSHKFVVPGGEDLGAHGVSELGTQYATPEAIRDELVSRGVTEVLVYTGTEPSWVNGAVLGTEPRYTKFAHMASQSGRGKKVWTMVPVERIGDGSDWSDIYGDMAFV